MTTHSIFSASKFLLSSVCLFHNPCVFLSLTLNLVALQLPIQLFLNIFFSEEDVAESQLWPNSRDHPHPVLYYLPTRCHYSMCVSSLVFSLYTVYIKFMTLALNVAFSVLSFFVTVVQRVDTVSEGIANYGGKINAVETNLKKLGKVHVS